MHRQNAPPIISGINTATDTKVKTMDDSEQIRNVIQLYIDSMNESNPDKVKQAFHGNAKVVGYLHGDFMEMSVDDFAEFCRISTALTKRKR